MFSDLSAAIDAAWLRRQELNSQTHDDALRAGVQTALSHLDEGSLRVAEKIDGVWHTHQWLKKAVLLSFRLWPNQVIGGTDNHHLMHVDGVGTSDPTQPVQPTQSVHLNKQMRFYDKVPLKFANYEAADFEKAGCRVVPPATVRYGSYISKDVVLMPSYVNIGAYVGEGTMVDTWATVGSCAQIGKNVHLSGGVGIGGVLEPLQANPTIIEDNCFIGARSEVVEGVIVEQNSVLSMGVFLSQSTKIYNRQTEEITYGRIPSGSVVVPGTLPSANGKVNLYCAVIVKQVDAQTRAKTSINELLRFA